MTDMGVEGLLPLRGLTTLNLGCCHHLTDAAARALAAGMQGLCVLDLRDTAVTDAGVRRLAEGLPNLRLLNLEHCLKVRQGLTVPIHIPTHSYPQLGGGAFPPQAPSWSTARR